MYISATNQAGQNLVFQNVGNTLITLRPETPAFDGIVAKFENKVITNGNLMLDDSMKMSGHIEILLAEAMNPYYSIEQDSAIVKSFITGFKGKEIVKMPQYNGILFDMCRISACMMILLKEWEGHLCLRAMYVVA